MSKRFTTVLTVLAATAVLGVAPASIGSSTASNGGGNTVVKDIAGGRWGCC
ncbi:hypothetical protein [Solicola sp. PLA-1-18]|uniref:hypothetical protein n=1 Tax=Solicola sp. PLA-1-18 TaxID=3380532 RepID=UPI003B785F27